MTVELKGNLNYAATVIEVPKLHKLPNSDRLYGYELFGYSGVADVSWLEREGEKAVVFVAETQISDKLAKAANLYRHKELNADPTEAGYLEDNRRVRAIRLRGNHSNLLMLPAEKVAKAFGVGVAQLEGSFDTIKGEEVCRKYEVPIKESTQPQSQVTKAFKRVIGSQLPEHYDTTQWRFAKDIGDREELIITQKLHGTSVRLGNVLTKRKLTWKDKIAKFFGVQVHDTEYDKIAGSRRVIKDIHDPYQGVGWYGEDLWGDALVRYENVIPEGFVVYGELIGFLPNGRPIQRGFTYDQTPGNYELYVYRVAVVTAGDDIVDLSWDQVRAWCARRNLKVVPELCRMDRGEFEVSKGDFEEQNFYYSRGVWNDRPVELSEGGTRADEGIAIRVESGVEPKFYKMKNQSFLEHETRLLDAEEIDTESAG